MSIVLLTYIQDKKNKNSKIFLPHPKCIMPFKDRIMKIKNVIKGNLY
jgi:hypothetical protein